MSSQWSNPTFDIFTPEATLTLNMTNSTSGGVLQYSGNVVSVSQTKTCNSTCGITDPGCDCNPPFSQNLCPPNSPDVLNIFSPINVIDQENCTDTSYYNVCSQQKEFVCGSFNGNATCTLGNRGLGNVVAPGNQNQQWAITSSTDWLQGWADCEYNYDYSQYNVETGPTNLSFWINDIYSGISGSAPTGMYSKYKNRIRDANFIYATLLDTFNQIYMTGYYSTNPGLSNFNNVDFISGDFPTFITSQINQLSNLIAQSYPSGGPGQPGGVPPTLITSLTEVMNLPSVSQQGDTYFLTVNVNYPQYVAFTNLLQGKTKSNSSADSFLDTLLNSLFRDSQGTMSNSTQSWSPNGPSMINSSVVGITAISLNGSSGTDYSVETGIPPAEFTIPTYANYIFATAQITGQINIWSPMLIAYVQAVDTSITFSSSVCKLLGTQSGILSPYSGTIPPVCFTQDCIDPSDCKQDITSFCQINYVPPGYTDHTVTDNYLITGDNSNCYCYTGTLAPVNQRTPGNFASMCFDNNCSSGSVNMRQLFGLTDTVCKGYCQTVYDWMNASGNDQPGNEKEMDWRRFGQICGTDFKPYATKSYNPSVLLIGSVLTIMMGILMFSVSKFKAYSTTKTVVIIIAVSLIFIGLTAFFTRDLAGISGCNGNNGKMVCTSRITKKTIPNSFCNYVLNCECQFDQDCPGQCVCQSSTCVPLSGSRPTKNVQERRPNIILIVISVIVLILLPVIMIYLHRDYHWGISKGTFILIMILIVIVPIAFILYTTLKKQSQTVFTGPCCTPKCENKECGDDGCGGQCTKPGSPVGSCSTCSDGKCVDPPPGKYQIVYDDPASGNRSGMHMSSAIGGGYALEMVPLENGQVPQPESRVVYGPGTITNFPQDLHWVYDGNNLVWHSDSGVITTTENGKVIRTDAYVDKQVCVSCTNSGIFTTCKTLMGGSSANCGINGYYQGNLIFTSITLKKDGSMTVNFNCPTGGDKCGSIMIAPLKNEFGALSASDKGDPRSYGWNFISL